MHPAAKLLTSVLLIVLVIASGVHYATVWENQYPYPTNEDLKTAPDEYIGEEVFVFGTVESVDANSNTATIRIESDAGPFTAQVTEFEPQRDVQAGGVVQVFGAFRGDSIAAENVRVVNSAGSSDFYKYAVSGVAAVLIVVLFFRYWRVNLRTLSVEGR